MSSTGRLQRLAQHYASGTTIFREGELGDRMYIIISGQVHIRKRTNENSHKILTTLKKGDVFGEMAIVEQKPRSASAIADGDCKLMVLDREAFYLLVSQNSEFAIKMIKSLSARLRKADHLIEQILGADMDKQIFQGISAYFEQKRFTDNYVAAGRISIREFLKWSTQNMGMNTDTVMQGIKHLAEKHVIHYWKEDPSNPQIQVSVNAMLKNRY